VSLSGLPGVSVVLRIAYSDYGEGNEQGDLSVCVCVCVCECMCVCVCVCACVRVHV
jgi:hypothetical protein